MFPFVRVFCSSPSAYLWGAHDPLSGPPEAIQRELNPNEKLFTFLDDLSKPDRVGALPNLSCGHSRIRVHGSKAHVWNQGGTKPEACDG